MEVLFTHEYTSFFHLAFCQFSNISSRFHCGHDSLPDIKENPSGAGSGAERSSWTWAGTWEFLSRRVDVGTAPSPPRVVHVRTTGINEEEGRDPGRADGQRPARYRMTSSHRSLGNWGGGGGHVTGTWVGDQRRMSLQRRKL